jgi:hypothetical protein
MHAEEAGSFLSYFPCECQLQFGIRHESQTAIDSRTAPLSFSSPFARMATDCEGKMGENMLGALFRSPERFFH